MAILLRCVATRYKLPHVGCCWVKFENGHILHATFVDVALCCSRFSQVRAAVLPPGLRTSSICDTQYVTTGWPNARNMLR